MRGVILALLIVSLSGCLVLPDEAWSAPREVPASELLEEAKRRTLERGEPVDLPNGKRIAMEPPQGDLRVAAIFALESTAMDDEWRLMGANYHAVHHWPDRALGDGRAPAWGYLFQDDSIYTFEQEIAASDDASMDARGGYPDFMDGYVSLGSHDRTFTEWSLDSTDAAEIAAERPEWQEAMKNATTVASILYRPEGQDDPFWLLGAHDGRLDPLGHVLVNARTGTMADVWAVHPPATNETLEHARVEARAKEASFRVGEPETTGLLFLRLSLSLRDPLAEVGFRVVDEERRIHDDRTIRPAGGSGGFYPIEDNAPYTVHVELDEGVLADVRLEACTVTHRWVHLFGAPDGCDRFKGP